MTTVRNERLRNRGWLMIAISLGSFAFMGGLFGAGPAGLLLFVGVLGQFVIGTALVLVARFTKPADPDALENEPVGGVPS